MELVAQVAYTTKAILCKFVDLVNYDDMHEFAVRK